MNNKVTKKNRFRGILTLAVFTTLVLTLNSCEQYEITEPQEVIENVSYSASIQPIFNSTCVTCHDGDGHSLDLTEGNSYAAMQAYSPDHDGEMLNTQSPAESILYIMANNGSHGFFSLSARQKELIRVWIQEGALDN